MYYAGVYDNSHTLGHSMGLFLMMASIYWAVAKAQKIVIPSWQKIVFVAILPAALFNLYFSMVRTEFVGLLILFLLFFFYYNKKLFGLGVAPMVVGMVALAPKLAVMFSDVVDVFAGERRIEKLASGRIGIWMHNLSELNKLPIESKLAGAGIGNRDEKRGKLATDPSFVPSHNDYLTVLTDTGVVGLAIFIPIQLAILAKILSLGRDVRFAFLALFVAVSAMNFASNSFFTRYGLAQMFYLVIAYVELNAKGVLGNQNGSRGNG